MATPLLAAGLEIGSLAEWFGAIGTIAGVSVTGIGLVREAARRRRAEEDRLAAQARLVYTRATLRGLASVAVLVMNESSGPILNLSARVFVLDSDNVVASSFGLAATHGHADRLDAHSSCELSIDLGLDDELELAASIAVELRFTDMAGLVWSRRDHGEPQRILAD
jgi:hypothetical protein